MSGRYSAFEIESPISPKETRDLSKSARLVVSSLMCLFCVANIILLLLILFNHSSSTNDDDFVKLMPIIDYITANLNTAPITQISITDSITNCPSDYVAQKLTAWPGSIEGCYCPEKSLILQGKCTSEKMREGCYRVPSLDSQILWLWNNDVYCIKRLGNYYLKPVTESCSNDYLNCGRMCVHSQEACPITTLKIKDTDKINQNDTTIEKVTLSDNKTLVISRELTSPPIYTLETSFHDKPCLEPAYIPAIKESNYPLLNIPSYSGCGEFGDDESSVILDNMDMNDLFKQNSLTSVENLPLYLTRESEAEAYLVARPRFALKKTSVCQSLDVRSISVLENLISSFKKFVIGGTIFPLIVVAGYSVFLMHLLSDQGSKKFPKRATKKWVPWAIFSACFIVLMIYCHSLSDENQDILDQKDFYAYIGSLDCFENDEISEALVTFSEHIPTDASNIMGYSDAIFWISIVLYFGAVGIKGYYLFARYYHVF